jgi:benzoylformate decarboxylase
MDFADPSIDFVQMARALGAEAERIEDPAELANCLHAAFRRPGTRLIEVIVDGTV